MKKQKIMKTKLTIAATLLATLSLAQGGGQKWSLSGNNVSQGDFLGTTNSSPLILKTNNQEWLRIRPNGEFRFLSLNNPGGLSGFMVLNTQGEASRLNFTGTTNDVVTGAGTFSNISSLTGFTLSGSNIVTNFNLGIGVATPTTMFHVGGTGLFNGDLTTTSNMYVNGTLKVGTNSVFVGTGVTDNFIYTDNGALRINGNEGQPTLQNTAINPDGAVATVGFPAGDIHGPNLAQIGQIHLMAKDFMMISGTNPTLTFKQTYSTTTPSPNVNGEMAIEYVNTVEGTETVTGINFWKPFPNTNGFDNYLLFVRTDGNIGIGTATPDHKLDVCGTIRSKEVFVEVGWCDYVFDESYKLKPLYEVEEYIKKNHHLPGIESEKEIETNGLKLAEMSAKHMEKIEELTLYIIEQQKQIDALKKEMEELKNK